MPGTDELLRKIEADKRVARLRFGCYSLLAILVILLQIGLAMTATLFIVAEQHEAGYAFLTLSTVSATMDSALSIQKRAMSAFSVYTRLEGLENSMLHESRASPFWEEYTALHAMREVSYLEGVSLLCR